jgi:hypothetical protein
VLRWNIPHALSAPTGGYLALHFFGFSPDPFVDSSPDHFVGDSTGVAGAPSKGNLLGCRMVINVGAARAR